MPLPSRRFIKSAAKFLWGFGLDLILPPRCSMTGELVGQNVTLDPRYWASLTFIQEPFCTTCGNPFGHDVAPGMQCSPCLDKPPVFNRARAALRYDDASSGLILKFKHGDATHLAPLFGNMLWRAGDELLRDADVLIPVPLHRWRLLKRRYNQAALLGAALAKLSGARHLPHTLRRSRHTLPQGHKDAAARDKNIAAAFAVADKTAITGKNIVLLDDVYTSGATVNECARTLLDAGAARVDVLCVAKVVRFN